MLLVHCYCCIVFACLDPFLFKCSFCITILYFCTFMYNFTFIFIFSLTHSGFNQKILTHILDIVFITRSHISLSEIHLKFVMGILVLRFLIGRWSVGRWSVGQWENPFKIASLTVWDILKEFVGVCHFIEVACDLECNFNKKYV